MTKTFYVVWCPTAGAPTVRHLDEGAARTEAVRLAKSNPGAEFFVLRATARVMTPPPVIIENLSTLPLDDGIPF